MHRKTFGTVCLLDRMTEVPFLEALALDLSNTMNAVMPPGSADHGKLVLSWATKFQKKMNKVFYQSLT